MIDKHSNNRPSGAAGSNLSKDVQLHVIRLTLNQLDQQLISMRESGGESVVEDIIDKSRNSTFIRTAVERELKRREQEDQLFARVEGVVQALSTADEAKAVLSSPPKDPSKSLLTSLFIRLQAGYDRASLAKADANQQKEIEGDKGPPLAAAGRAID